MQQNTLTELHPPKVCVLDWRRDGPRWLCNRNNASRFSLQGKRPSPIESKILAINECMIFSFALLMDIMHVHITCMPATFRIQTHQAACVAKCFILTINVHLRPLSLCMGYRRIAPEIRAQLKSPANQSKSVRLLSRELGISKSAV
jgi:hypothetical protein